MTYLFGDSTPFPLNDNFIETLRDLTDACVALLRIDERLDQAYDRADEIKAAAEKEQARLEAVASSIVRAMEPHIGESEPPSAGQVAVRVMQAARGVLEAARSEAASRRDSALRDVEARIADARAGIPVAIESFFSRRELPETTWSFRWKAGLGDAPATAQVLGKTTFGLELVMEVDVPRAHVYSRPIRVGELDRGVAVPLPDEGGWLRRGPRLRPHSLDGYFVTEVERSPERAAMVLRKSGKQPSEGLEIVVRQEGQSRPTAKKLTEAGVALAEVVAIEGVGAKAIAGLWSRVESSLDEFTRRRTRLVRASLDGKAIRDVERPAALAEKMVACVAPLVREMRRRGASADELVLKRDLGGGRREELFVSRQEIVKKWADLSPSRRAVFDAFGLAGEESGVILVSSDYDAEEDTNVDPRARRSSQPAAASA